MRGWWGRGMVGEENEGMEGNGGEERRMRGWWGRGMRGWHVCVIIVVLLLIPDNTDVLYL